MIRIQMNVSYDRPLTAAEEERLRLAIRDAMVPAISQAAAKTQRDDGSFMHSLLVTVDGDIKVTA